MRADATMTAKSKCRKCQNCCKTWQGHALQSASDLLTLGIVFMVRDHLSTHPLSSDKGNRIQEEYGDRIEAHEHRRDWSIPVKGRDGREE